jgi:cyclic pyranopterin phosphate synthase
MDVGRSNNWRPDQVVPAAEIASRIDTALPLEGVPAAYRGEDAERWRYRDGTGEIGNIASVTQAFCRDCTRARLSTEGRLYLCLFADHGHDLRSPLRAGASDAQLASLVAGIWQQRSDRYSEIRSAAVADRNKIEMSYIGG